MSPYIHSIIYKSIYPADNHPSIKLLTIHLAIHPSIHLSIHPSNFQFIHLPNHLSNYLIINPHIHLLNHQFTYPSTQPSIHISIYSTINSHIHLFNHQSTSSSIRQSTHPSIHPLLRHVPFLGGGLFDEFVDGDDVIFEVLPCAHHAGVLAYLVQSVAPERVIYEFQTVIPTFCKHTFFQPSSYKPNSCFSTHHSTGTLSSSNHHLQIRPPFLELFKNPPSTFTIFKPPASSKPFML